MKTIYIKVNLVFNNLKCLCLFLKKNYFIIKDFDIQTYSDRVLFPTQYGKKIDLKLASSIYESLTSLIYDAASLKLDPNSPDNRVGDYLWYYYNKLLSNNLTVNLFSLI